MVLMADAVAGDVLVYAAHSVADEDVSCAKTAPRKREPTSARMMWMRDTIKSVGVFRFAVGYAKGS